MGEFARDSRRSVRRRWIVVLALATAACGGKATVTIGQDGGPHGSRKDAGVGDAPVVDSTRTDVTTDSTLPRDTGVDVDAADSPGVCTGIACNIETCGGGIQTSVSGYVYAPNGTLPLYNVQVFIPNAPLAPFAAGVHCDNCAGPLSGEPIATALSDATGHFVLEGVPTGTNVPIVVQLGKWRRQANIPRVNGCVDNPLTDPNLTRLPKNQSEGSMPHIALTTGGCDQMGCMLPKLGIDPMEFGSQTDGTKKAVNVYQGSAGGTPLGATPAMNLWGDATVLNTYDVAIFSCECSEAPTSKGGGFGAAPFGIVTDYLNAGGRILTADFQYTWYKFSPDPNIGETIAGSPTIGLGEIEGGAPIGGNPLTLATTAPKPVALAAWLKNIFSGVPLPSGATFPLDSYAQVGEVEPDVVFSNIQSLDPTKTVTWASSPSPEGPRAFTVDTPVGVPSDKQCGRGIHVDAHVDTSLGQTVGPGYPTTGCSATLAADEAAFAFLFFELSSCIQNELVAPTPPPKWGH